MGDIRFSAETLAGFGVSGALMVILPIILMLILKKKMKLKLKPIIVGAIVFPLFALVLKILPAYLLLMADSELSRTINGSVWLNFLVAGLLAGIFEETGRFIAFKTVLKSDAEKKTAIGYGIGHGGFECVYIGITMFSFIAMGIMVNNGEIAMLTGSMDEAAASTAIEQLREYSQRSFGLSMLGIVERASVITAQIAMSILVFAAARDKKLLWLFPFTVFIHAATDFMIVFYQLGYISAVLFEVLLLAYAVILLFCAVRLVYRKMGDV